MPTMYLISLAAAELVKHLKVMSGFFRTAFFLPVVVSAVAAGAIFRLILNTKMGLVNKILFSLGVNQINFLGDAQNALIACAMLAIWLGNQRRMIIYSFLPIADLVPSMAQTNVGNTRILSA